MSDPVRRRRPTPAELLYAAALAALVVPRLHSSSPLWLDEALSVDIARLPLPDLLTALRHDGSPPLYYVLLHGWIAVLGTGDVAVRSLSGLVSLLALPVAWVAGRRLGGPRVAAASALVVAASPFAIRYATETRMYSLVVLLALVAVVVVDRALEAPRWGRLVQVGAVTGLLALTHYWTLFLIAPGGLYLAARAVREGVRGPAARVLAAVAGGGVLFWPWLPSFLFQAAHTGTPWRGTPTSYESLTAVGRWGGPGVLGGVLGGLLILLALVSLRHRPARVLLWLAIGGLAIALLASRVQGSAYAWRYTAPLVAPYCLAVAVAVGRLPRAWRYACSAAVVALALAVCAFTPLLGSRTQAAQVAGAIAPAVGPGDVVVYCPDQLGPPVARLLPTTLRQVVYPTMGSPALVDWVDYAARNEAASPSEFAASVAADTSGTVWLVRADGYATFGDQCARLDDDLSALRPGRRVELEPGATRDGAYVVAFPAAS